MRALRAANYQTLTWPRRPVVVVLALFSVVVISGTILYAPLLALPLAGLMICVALLGLGDDLRKLFLGSLGALLVGYAFFGRGLAHVGMSPIFVRRNSSRSWSSNDHFEAGTTEARHPAVADFGLHGARLAAHDSLLQHVRHGCAERCCILGLRYLRHSSAAGFNAGKRVPCQMSSGATIAYCRSSSSG